MDTIRCPACGSASVRKRTIVYRSGMSYGSRRGRGGDWLRVSVGSIWPRALLSELGWSGIPRSSKTRDAAPTAFWPAILALVVLLFVPDGGGWAQMGFVLALVWLSIAAADHLALERQWVCDLCGSTFTPEPNRDAETEIELDPRSEAPAGEVVTLAPTAKHHLADGKTCSICGEWFPHAELKYGNRDNRSYCRTCNREERVAYAEGGREGARQYRKAMRGKWKGAESGVRG